MTRYPEMTKEEQELAKVVGAQMQTLRMTRELSQVELAKRTGLSQTTVTTIETGKRPPNLRTLTKIANTLGYDVNFQFVENGEF